MISKDRALQLIQDSLNSLHRVGLLEEATTAGHDTVLLGKGSKLDSIAFVTFVTELEDRINRESDREHYLVLNDIHEYNTNVPCLSADTLARYVVKLTE